MNTIFLTHGSGESTRVHPVSEYFKKRDLKREGL